jgi:hypothetical protein
MGVVAVMLAAAPSAWASDAGAESDVTSVQNESDTQQAFDATLEQTFSAPQTPRVGDDLELTLDVEHRANATVTLPDEFGTARWELEDTKRSTTATQAEGEKTTLELTFQIFRPGATTLPSFDVTVLDEQGRVVTLATEPVETKIISVLDAEKKAELLPPRPTVDVWVEDYTLAWVGGALGVAALAALVVFLLMRRREEDRYAAPERPAHVVALEKLSSLSPGDLLERGQYMLFYVRMSEAVREYLGRRYGFHGTELTTTEILDHLEDVEWPESLSFDQVRSWMHHCDLIKFSGQIPSRDEAEDALRRAFAIVELTRPPEKTEDEQEDPAEEAQRASHDPAEYEPDEQRSPYAPSPDESKDESDKSDVGEGAEADGDDASSAAAEVLENDDAGDAPDRIDTDDGEEDER